MRQLILLLKVYGLELFGINKRVHMPGKRMGRRASGIVMWILCALAVIGVLAFSSVYCAIAAYAAKEVGLLHLFPGLVFALISLMDLITTVAKSSDVLVKTKDFDIVTALPIPGWALAASRVLRLYLINLASTAAIAVPAGICYGIFAEASAWFYPMYAIAILLAPLLPVAIAAALGSVIATVSASVGNSKALRLILSFSFPLLIMYVSMRVSVNSMSETAFFNMLWHISDIINRLWMTTELFSRACVQLDALALLEFAGISIGAFGVFCLFYGKLYVKFNSMTDGQKTRHRAANMQGARSMGMALYCREIRRYFASTAYVTNTAFGMVLSLIGVIALACTGMEKFTALLELSGAESYVVSIVPMTLAMFAGMSVTTSSSISMEGKSLWICRSLPIPAFPWLMAKLLVSLTVCIPICLADAIILAIALRLNAAAFLLTALLPMCFSVFASLLGLWCNIRFHKLEWTNETAIVKQSLPVWIQVFGSMAFMLAGIFCAAYFGGAWLTWTPWGLTGGSALLSAVMLILLKNNAERIAQSL